MEQSERVDIATLANVADALGVQVSAVAFHSGENTSVDTSKRLKQLTIAWEEAYMSCDVDRILAFHHPDTVLELPGSDDLTAGGTFRGIDQLRAHLESAFQCFRVVEVHERKMHVVENLVFYRPILTLLVVPKGTKFTIRFLNEIEFRGDKICRRMTLTDWGVYRAHLGVPES